MPEKNMEVLLGNINDYIRRILLYYSISGQFPEGWQGEDYNGYLQQHSYSLLLMVFTFSGEPLTHAKSADLENTIVKRFSNISAKVYKTYVVCLAFCNGDELATGREMVSSRLEQLLNTLGLRVNGFLSRPGISVTELPGAYQQLNAQAMVSRLDTRTRFSMLVNLYSLEEELYNCVLEVDPDEIRRLLNIIAKIVSQVDAAIRTNCWGYFCFLWRSVERAVFQRVGRRKTAVDKLVIDEELSACSTANEMADVIYSFIITYANDLQLQDHSGYNKVIERTKDYIKEKLAEEITLETVAAEAGISPCYLSKLFCKQVGVRFKEYVVQVRMERAKYLLSIGQLNIAEVARACGYKDAGYFCRAFKRHWDVSPKEFQMRT